VFDGLRSNAWGERVRLEQERLPWDLRLDRRGRNEVGGASERLTGLVALERAGSISSMRCARASRFFEDRG